MDGMDEFMVNMFRDSKQCNAVAVEINDICQTVQRLGLGLANYKTVSAIEHNPRLVMKPFCYQVDMKEDAPGFEKYGIKTVSVSYPPDTRTLEILLRPREGRERSIPFTDVKRFDTVAELLMYMDNVATGDVECERDDESESASESEAASEPESEPESEDESEAEPEAEPEASPTPPPRAEPEAEGATTFGLWELIPDPERATTFAQSHMNFAVGSRPLVRMIASPAEMFDRDEMFLKYFPSGTQRTSRWILACMANLSDFVTPGAAADYDLSVDEHGRVTEQAWEKTIRRVRNIIGDGKVVLDNVARQMHEELLAAQQSRPRPY